MLVEKPDGWIMRMSTQEPALLEKGLHTWKIFSFVSCGLLLKSKGWPVGRMVTENLILF